MLQWQFRGEEQGEHSEVLLDVGIRKGCEELWAVSLGVPFTSARGVDVPGSARGE